MRLYAPPEAECRTMDSINHVFHRGERNPPLLRRSHFISVQQLSRLGMSEICSDIRECLSYRVSRMGGLELVDEQQRVTIENKIK